ncbi:hypothetical protein [Marinicella rhabdoformis]|uniref:hypothetical protein n=1 Tax=Marinicella rhabdoformis TaxID=2580566 RepID=UPI0012AEB2FE|nr:hypothetical protein [Marinicella rhabdoformis]
MKKIVFLMLILNCGLVFSESPNIERKVWKEVEKTSKVVIKNMIGDVRVRSTKIEDEFEIIAVEQHNEKEGVLVVETDTKDGVFYISVARKNKEKKEVALRMDDQARIDLTVFVPKGNDIDVETFDGLIEAKGLIDPLTATTQEGNIKMLKNKNSLNVFSYSGDVEANVFPNSTKNDQSFKTGTGQVSVIVGDKQNLDFTITTSGRITTDFGLTINKDFTKEPNKVAYGKVNEGGSKIEMESIRGNVTFLSYQEKAQ